MEEAQHKIHYLHDAVLRYLKSKEKTEEEVISWLISQGVSAEKSKIVVTKLQQQLLRHKKAEKRNTILGGLLICGIGILFTVLQTGYIWWGAIIFGGIQFFRGTNIEIE